MKKPAAGGRSKSSGANFIAYTSERPVLHLMFDLFPLNIRGSTRRRSKFMRPCQENYSQERGEAESATAASSSGPRG